MGDILAVVLVFGGLAAFMLSISPVGSAIADRIRSGHEVSKKTIDELRASYVGLHEELDQLRGELRELRERIDFTERLLERRPGTGSLSPPRGDPHSDG